MNSKEIEWEMSKYEDTNYNSRQLEEIYQGLESGIDVSKYANLKLNHEEMAEIAEMLFDEKEERERVKEPKMEI